MDKKWQVKPKIKLDHDQAQAKYSWVVLQLLNNRGIKKSENIKKFLQPNFKEEMSDPFVFKDMEKAVELVIKHVKAGNKILIYGDYDADGVTAAAVLYEALTILRGKVDIYLPDRVSEGYGLNKGALDKIKSMDVKLIITVDTGIRGREEVEEARKLGMEIIITDHHVAPEKKKELPACLIINPQVSGEPYPFKILAGAGVAWQLARAIVNKSTLSEEQKRRISESLLDFVAIGTVADCVSLIGENRILVKKGLEVLNHAKRAGIKELIVVAQIRNEQALESWNIAFQIAPRLNAAGRMEHANTAFNILVTKDKEEAISIARRLNSRNQDRQAVTEKIVKEVEEQIEGDKALIVGLFKGEAGKEAWNEGVIGLVAGKISEKYYRPTLIITKTDDSYKGSGRSIEQFNIIKALEEAGDLLKQYGGHARACGFSLSKKNISAFVKRIEGIAEAKLELADLKPNLTIDAELNLEEVNEELISEVGLLAPFGQGNQQPKFVSRDISIVDIFKMGHDGQHLKLHLKSRTSRKVAAIGFSQAEKWPHLCIGDKIDIVYYIGINEFNGRRDVQLKIVDIKKCE